MFHVELRQFPHQTRAFNLTRQELDARILGPWVSGGRVELDDRRWTSDRARLTIYEGPVLTGDQLGLGRGWANVTRQGEDVTERLLAEAAHPPPVAELKRELVERSADGPIAFGAVVELAGERYPQSRLSERVALCEQAVWELLHEGAVELTRDGAPVARERWQEVLLTWAAWRDGASIARS
ncbi:MAG: hypothetical protein WAL38_00930 [Solirubrobacteraceae bacterium]